MPIRACAGTIGSFFGRGVIKHVSKGVLVGSESADFQPIFTDARGPDMGYKCACGRTFTHAPAFASHKVQCWRARFVGGDESEIDESISLRGASHSSESSMPQATASSSSVGGNSELANGDHATNSNAPGKPVKLRKSDGLPKESGLKEGMHRQSHTLYFKYQVAQDYEDMKNANLTNALQRTMSMYPGLSKSLISKWHGKLGMLREALTHEHGRGQVNSKFRGKLVPFSSKKARKTSLHPGRKMMFAAAEVELLHLFRQERRRGLRINDRWLCVKMKSIVREHYGEDKASLFKASHGWLLAFADRNSLSLRRANNIKHAPVEERLPRIKRWHARLRRRLKTKSTLGTTLLDPLWGRWLPRNRLSCDQVPCNLREGIKATYDEKGSGRIWIAGNKADDGKRFCTLQIIARAENGPTDLPRRGQPPIGIIFKGTGQRVSQEEKAAHHPDVRVRFQKKAWADAAYCIDHAENEMAEATAAARALGEESVCFYDNLHGQTTDEHEKALLEKACCVRHLLPAGVTSEIQLIDDGVGHAVKKEMGHALDDWLSKDSNLEEWTGNMPAWRKRVQITHFAANAWEKVCASFDFERAATRIGMRMTIEEGNGDDQIKIQGVSNYSFSDRDAGDDTVTDIVAAGKCIHALPLTTPFIQPKLWHGQL